MATNSTFECTLQCLSFALGYFDADGGVWTANTVSHLAQYELWVGLAHSSDWRNLSSAWCTIQLGL